MEGVFEPLVWDTPIPTSLIWTTRMWEGSYNMKQFRKPVRKDDPRLISYTFRDLAGVVIDLTDRFTVLLKVKKVGGTYETVTAEFDGAKTTGKVKYSGYAFAAAGIYNIQFDALDSFLNQLHGDPAQVTVVNNVEDLGTDDLMVY